MLMLGSNFAILRFIRLSRWINPYLSGNVKLEAWRRYVRLRAGKPMGLLVSFIWVRSNPRLFLRVMVTRSRVAEIFLG
jgi:hypothetical protein